VDPVSGAEEVYNTFAYTDGFNSKPQPFRCGIAVRSSRIQETLEREARLGDKFLERYN
jgi:hypothetical protein